MKIFNLALILLLIHFTLLAQVIKVDCCSDIGSKATIIINNNLTTLSTSTPSTTSSNVCNFKLNSSANTSAGVYKVTGSDTTLIRTLFSGVHFDAGCYTVNWDGLLDDGARASNGSYLIKILSNNVTYKWGLIGNSSKSFTNNEQYNAYTDIYDVSLTNNNIYYALGYAERDIKTRYAPLNDLGRCVKVDENGNSLSADKVAADENNIYWSGYSDDGTKFIIGYRQSDNSQFVFTNGVKKQMDYSGNIYTSCIGVDTAGISGLSANSNFIFSSRYWLNKITAYNKITGSTSSVNILPYPGNIACTVDNTKLWVVSAISFPSFSALQYSIAADGSLTPTGLSINCDKSSSLSISPVTGELAIVRYSTGQVKIYNGATGALNITIGLAGGYPVNGPDITDNKFSFYDYSVAKFGKDGSLWVTDNGNRRLEHMGPTGTHIETIASCGINYFVAVDIANPTRVFAGNVEYSVDYSKDLSVSAANGWAHAKSWLSVVSGDESNYGPFRMVCTLPNGKTYALVNDRLYELREGVGAVYLGNGFGGKNIEKDGSLWTRNTGNPNNIVKQAYTGYDSNTNMPSWGPPQLVVDATNSPVPFSYNNNTLGAATNPRRYFFYNPNYGYVPNNGLEYHLGSIKTSNNTTDWQTSLLTTARYVGPFPNNGYFDQSGHSENCVANIVRSNVFWHMNQELGRFTEVCYTNHYNEDGLFIGQFGNDNYKTGQTGDNSFLAGNSFATHAFQIPNSNDIGYITGDESKHAAVQFVRISNLSSIHEDILPVTLSGAVQALGRASTNQVASLPYASDDASAIANDTTNLMASLPYASDNASAIANNTTKWKLNSRSGATAFQTSIGTFSKDSIDVYCKTFNGSLSVSRYLNNSTLNKWTLTGRVSINGNSNGNNYNNYFDLLDLNGKRIARLYASNNYYGIYLNGNVFISGGLTRGRLFNDISYTYNGTSIIVNYLGQTAIITSPDESGALLSSPGKLRVLQSSTGGDQVLDVYNLKFVPES